MVNRYGKCFDSVFLVIIRLPLSTQNRLSKYDVEYISRYGSVAEVVLEDCMEAKEVIERLNGVVWYGQVMRVAFAHPDEV